MFYFLVSKDALVLSQKAQCHNHLKVTDPKNNISKKKKSKAFCLVFVSLQNSSITHQQIPEVQARSKHVFFSGPDF